MKIFITGSTGFIGQNLVKFYKNQEIFEFKRYMNINEKLAYFNPDVIINCAAEIYDKEKMWDANVLLTKSCLDFCVKKTDTILIQLGSSSEYGKANKPTKETDPIDPTDMYAGTKGIATLMCQTYSKSYGIDVTIIRPYSLYGPGERPHRLFPNLWKSFKLNHPMNLVMGVHDFCYIDDFVDAIDLVIQSKNREPGDILNVSSGVESSNLEVFKLFQKITGVLGNVTLLDKVVTQPVWQSNIDKIKSKYNWQPKNSLETGIKLFLERANYE